MYVPVQMAAARPTAARGVCSELQTLTWHKELYVVLPAQNCRSQYQSCHATTIPLHVQQKSRKHEKDEERKKALLKATRSKKSKSQKFARVQPRRKFPLIRRLGLYRLARAPKARRRREYHNTKLRIRKTQTHDRGPEIEMLKLCAHYVTGAKWRRKELQAKTPNDPSHLTRSRSAISKCVCLFKAACEVLVQPH